MLSSQGQLAPQLAPGVLSSQSQLAPPYSVVVLEESHRPRGPHAAETRRLPLRVDEAPVLVPRHCLLQDALRREVKSRRDVVAEEEVWIFKAKT